ncbi:hypothetical protein K440DRAFT_614686 [Wilcoxina mikolae CBS 423.85]|nr:hypothetical protein K440DRAFT_614686 [Wilcoxina mikolae CBS 423.85]
MGEQGAVAVVAAEELLCCTQLTRLDGAITDDCSHIPAKQTLPPHRSNDHVIDPGHKLPYGRIYYLSEVESRTLKAYIETNHNLSEAYIETNLVSSSEEGWQLETQKLTTELSTRAQSRIAECRFSSAVCNRTHP